MKVTVKKVDALKRELRLEIPSERVSAKMEEVYKEIGKEAKVKGFRPGKAPRHVLEAEHKDLAQEETIKKLIPEVYDQAIEQEKLEPVDLPEIRDVEMKNGMITFTAEIDVKPEIKLGDYKGIKIKRKSAQVTDEEISKTLDYLKQGQGKEKDVPFG